MNKQDQEEHRLAAKAAGFDCEYDSDFDAMHNTTTGNGWHPKIRKDDSFDLMVACGIVVNRCGESVIAESDWAPEVLHVEWGYNAEAYMKVVFYGAVKIGMAMEL